MSISSLARLFDPRHGVKKVCPDLTKGRLVFAQETDAFAHAEFLLSRVVFSFCLAILEMVPNALKKDGVSWS